MRPLQTGIANEFGLAAIVKGLRTTTAGNTVDSSAVTGVEAFTNGNRQRIRRLAAIVKGLQATTAGNRDDSSAVTGVEAFTRPLPSVPVRQPFF
ncbi:hypothetical protein [Ammoniphilus oxalaticus]|uniref:hypothetical protein n=1 Tax=Ammoniphilus oxalaticus TaxID=66863 RepID=UPI0011C38992|nr:hypothetical protein [Ammoniphilus oxalaticus]